MEGFGCIDTLVGSIDGRIDRYASKPTVTAAFGVNRSLTCAGGTDGYVLGTTVGVSFSGTMVGAKVQ